VQILTARVSIDSSNEIMLGAICAINDFRMSVQRPLDFGEVQSFLKVWYPGTEK